MLQRLTLTLLLVVTIARSSKNNISLNSKTCPKNCHCTVSTKINFNDEINENNNNSDVDSIEVRCFGIPRIENLPKNSKILMIMETKSWEIRNFIVNLENHENIIDLRELALINCNLTSFKVKINGISKISIFVAFSLNLSNNVINSSENIIINDAERLSEFDLSQNHLSHVTSEAFIEYPRLLKLYLRDNFIVKVEKNGFKGLDLLESLDLSDNRIAELDKDIFVPLCNLKSLNLSGNRLGILGQRLFENLENLRQLDVSRNVKLENQQAGQPEINKDDVELSLILGSLARLEMIDASKISLERVPSSLTRSVRTLNLSGNKLTIIRSGDFDSYPLLRVLDLSQNMIVNVENDALGRLEILEKLDLSFNHLQEFPQSLPSSLSRLRLRENFIVKLSTRDFDGLEKLKSLVIDKNSIRCIEQGTMLELSQLNELDLSENPILQLPADTFGGMTNLVNLRMSGLTSLFWDEDKIPDMSFPVPSPEKLIYLDISESPALARQLLSDEAALSACKSLRVLNVASTNLTDIRSDLSYLLPQLRSLGLSGNRWNCTNKDNNVNWLAEWIVEHEEIWPPAECTFDNDTRILLVELPILNHPTTRRINAAKDFNGGIMNIKRFQDSSESRGINESLRVKMGIFILVLATIGCLTVAMIIVLSRRRGTTFGEQLERYDQRRPIVTELW